jgi:hypothetical protein
MLTAVFLSLIRAGLGEDDERRHQLEAWSSDQLPSMSSVEIASNTISLASARSLVQKKLNAKSSTEAELIAVSDGLPRVLWIREFIIGQGFNLPPTTVFQDNLSTIEMLNNGRATVQKTRYIAIRFFCAKDRASR